MQLRCYRCGWSFSLSREQVEFALENMKAKGDKHYDVRCTRCRTVNKIPIKQLERSAPRPTSGSSES
ncbi:MAG TPA: hypothetical protein VLL77_14075 [Anaerolineales bacterium]|nr:hypothetical protein [Anaerolineales bacterium]